MEITRPCVTVERAITKGIAQRVFSNFGWSVVSEAVSKGVFFVVNIYLARTLGVVNFGFFTLAQTVTFYFWLAVDLGTNMYGIREIAKNRENAEDIINSLLTLRITAGIIVYSLYSLCTLFCLNMSFANKLTFAGCGLYLLTYSFYTDWVLKGFEKFKFIALGSLVSSAIFLFGTFSFIKADRDVSLASFIWSVSYLFGSLSLLYFLYKKLGIRYKPCFNFNRWFSHIRESIFFTISGSLMILYQYLPILLLSVFFTAYEVGLFSAPYRIVTAISGGGLMIVMAFYPVFSDLYYKDMRGFRKTHRLFQRIIIIVGLPVAIVGTLLGDEIVRIALGAQYMRCTSVFKALTWLAFLNFVRYSYGPVLLATGFQRLHNLATFVGAACVLVAGILLIPKYGVTGAVVSLLFSEVSIIGVLACIFHGKVQQGIN
jgi:O-antigen/teichoic acid export membrane protein